MTPSAAKLVYRHCEDDLAVLGKYEELVEEADLFDGGLITLEHVEKPQGSVLLALLLDPRTGLGLCHDFTISNLAWSAQMPKLHTMHTVDEIPEMSHTQERIRR